MRFLRPTPVHVALARLGHGHLLSFFGAVPLDVRRTVTFTGAAIREGPGRTKRVLQYQPWLANNRDREPTDHYVLD